MGSQYTESCKLLLARKTRHDSPRQTGGATSRAQPLGPDAEFLVCHHDLMEPADEGSRAQIRRLVMLHDLDNLLKTLNHRFLEPRVHQRQFVDAVQHLLPNRRGKGTIRHSFNASNHLSLGTDTNTLFHQPKTYVRDIFDPFEIAHRHSTGIGID